MDNEMTRLASELLTMLAPGERAHRTRAAENRAGESLTAAKSRLELSANYSPEERHRSAVRELSERFERASRCFDSHFELY